MEATLKTHFIGLAGLASLRKSSDGHYYAVYIQETRLLRRTDWPEVHTMASATKEFRAFVNAIYDQKVGL
jgi:hypothetical protein